MADEVKDVTETSSTPSALESAIASSPEVKEEAQQTQEAQTPTAEQGETQGQGQQPQEEARIPYSRFKEKVDESNWYKGQLEQLIQQRQTQLQFQQPTQDPYAGMSAEEKVFWQNIDKRIEDRARQIAQTEMQQVRPVIDAGRMELAQMKVSQFRTTHPDIKPNSPEEIEIAEKINLGYQPDDAYWAVMGPRGIRVAATQAKQQVKQQIEAKKKANVEVSTSIPQQAQPQPKKKFRDAFRENWEKLERGESL